MNANRRKQIQEVEIRIEALQTDLEELIGSLSSIQDDEQEYHDNMPESFQYGDKGSAVEEIIDTLQSALDELDTASTSLTDCVEYLVQARESGK